MSNFFSDDREERSEKQLLRSISYQLNSIILILEGFRPLVDQQAKIDQLSAAVKANNSKLRQALGL